MVPEARILHLRASNFYGGPEKQIVEHLKTLGNGGYAGSVASFSDGSRNEFLERAARSGLPARGVPMTGPLDLGVVARLGRLLKEESIDLLCAHGYKAIIVGLLAGRRVGVPVVAFSRGYTGENMRVRLYEAIERYALRQASGVVFGSHAQRQRAGAARVHDANGWVVHNAVSVTPRDDRSEDVRDRLGISRSDLLVVAAGRLSPEKGHRFLVEAAGRLRATGVRGAQYLFCGDGSCRSKLERQARRLGLTDCCHFVGFRRDLQTIFQSMDLMVLPSLTEGLPNVLLEAFSCSKAVVATDVGGVGEVVVNGLNGVLVPPAQPEALASAIATLLGAPDVRRAMGEAGRRTAERDFTFETQTRRLQSVYEEVLGSLARQREGAKGLWFR